LLKSPETVIHSFKTGDFMKPKIPEKRDQGELFRSRLEQILNRKHPLFILANQILWSVFDQKFGPLYSEKGRPGKSTRLMVGLHYLKHAFNESDETVVARLLENPYWQYFCGFEYFIHRLPVDPSSLTRWRHRIGPEGLEQRLRETLETAKRGEKLTERHMERVNVDTTVQEKAIAYPTDAALVPQSAGITGQSGQGARHSVAPELPSAGQKSPDHVRPLRPCPANETIPSGAEKPEKLPGPGLS